MNIFRDLPADQQSSRRMQSYLSLALLRQGEYAEVVAVLDRLFDRSLASSDLDQLSLRTGSNLNLNRALALQRLGRGDEASAILERERRLLDQAIQDGMQRGYHFLDAKIRLLSDDREGGLLALDTAFRNFEAWWLHRNDPVLLALVGEAELAAMTRWLDEHIDDDSIFKVQRQLS